MYRILFVEDDAEMGQLIGVITSYSIHYTKLYEHQIRRLRRHPGQGLIPPAFQQHRHVVPGQPIADELPHLGIIFHKQNPVHGPSS